MGDLWYTLTDVSGKVFVHELDINFAGTRRWANYRGDLFTNCPRIHDGLRNYRTHQFCSRRYFYDRHTGGHHYFQSVWCAFDFDAALSTGWLRLSRNTHTGLSGCDGGLCRIRCSDRTNRVPALTQCAASRAAHLRDRGLFDSGSRWQALVWCGSRTVPPDISPEYLLHWANYVKQRRYISTRRCLFVNGGLTMDGQSHSTGTRYACSRARSRSCLADGCQR